MSTSVELPEPADLMKRVPKRFIKILALLIFPFVLIYVGYFFYLGRHSLAGFTPESEAFWAIGNALLESQIGKQKKFAVALTAVEGPDMCSFWKFEAVRTHCQGVSLVVRDFEESDREKVTQLARFIAERLSKPCQYVALVAPPDTSLPGYMRTADHAKLRANLGCGQRNFVYTFRVQAFTGTFVELPGGDGYYVNHHIYTHRLQGEIQ